MSSVRYTFCMKLIFEPKQWHACHEGQWQTCRGTSNCYSYALNKPEYYWSVPGMGYVKMAGQKFLDVATSIFQQYSLKDFQAKLKSGAKADGLIPIDTLTAKDGYYMIALFLSDNPVNLDFHWYRQDDDGTWSSKNGWHAPSKKDPEGNIIRDPRYVTDPDYPIFSGFYLVPKTGVTLQPSTLLASPYVK